MSDEVTLVQSAQNGDVEAFGELVRTYDRRLFRVAMHILHHREDAEDVVQNACLSAFQHIAGFRGECRFSTWLLKITVNESLTRLRSRTNEQAATDGLDSWVEEVFEQRDIPDWRLHPERQYQRAELRRLLQNALEQLPVAYSVVFMLRDIEGFSTAEVADALRITISATKVRLLRARLKLRDKLGVHFESRVKQARLAQTARAATARAATAGIGVFPRPAAFAGGD